MWELCFPYSFSPRIPFSSFLLVHLCLLTCKIAHWAAGFNFSHSPADPPEKQMDNTEDTQRKPYSALYDSQVSFQLLTQKTHQVWSCYKLSAFSGCTVSLSKCNSTLKHKDSLTALEKVRCTWPDLDKKSAVFLFRIVKTDIQSQRLWD